MDVADAGEDASKAEKKRTVSFKVPSAVAGLIVGKGVGIKKQQQMQMLPETFAVPAECFRVLASDSAHIVAKCSL